VAEGGTLYRWAHHHVRTIPDETPALLRDMPSDTVAIQREFADRVAARFPDGTPVAVLTAEFRHEGFDVPDGYYANFVQKKGFCLQGCLVHWTVGWTRDTQGRATGIVADYGPIGIPYGPFDELLDTDPR
jgi:hypothetical protein